MHRESCSGRHQPDGYASREKEMVTESYVDLGDRRCRLVLSQPDPTSRSAKGPEFVIWLRDGRLVARLNCQLKCIGVGEFTRITLESLLVLVLLVSPRQTLQQL
jgi:hypothetical protein